MFEARLCSLTDLEALGLMVLGIEDLDQPVSVDGLLGNPRDIAHRVLDALAVAAKAARLATLISQAMTGAATMPGNRRQSFQFWKNIMTDQRRRW